MSGYMDTLGKSGICVVTAVLSIACGAAPPPYRTADHWSKAVYLDEPNRYESLASPRSAGGETETGRSERQNLSATVSHSDVSPAPGTVPRIAPPPPTRAPLMNKEACLKELRQRNIQFSPLSELKGVENPVEIHGSLGGVEFWANDGRQLQLDCRLALALDELAATMRRSGVTRIRYSGAYSYRTTRSGRLSHHALGLAIDLHDFEFGAQTVTVSDDFARNVGCSTENPRLNQLACAMRQQALFEEFLTPDYNYDHRDHLHISVPRRSK